MQINIKFRFLMLFLGVFLLLGFTGAVFSQEDDEAAGLVAGSVKKAEPRKDKPVKAAKTKADAKAKSKATGKETPVVIQDGTNAIPELDGTTNLATPPQTVPAQAVPQTRPESVTNTGDEDIIIEDEINKTPAPRTDVKQANTIKTAESGKKNRDAFGNLETFEKELGLDYWFGSGGDSRFFYKRTDKDSYAGRYSLYVEYEIGMNTADNYIQIIRTLPKPVDMSGYRSLVFWVKSSGRGGGLAISITSPSGSYTYCDSYCLYNTEWTKVVVPLSEAMNKVDLKQLTGYTFSVTAGVATSEIKEQNMTVLSSPNESLPFRNSFYIDEISMEINESKIDSGKRTFNYSGSVNVAYNNQDNSAPYMASQAAINMALLSEKYSVNANVSVPVTFPAEYLTGLNESAVRYQSYNFDTKDWGWTFSRPIYVYSISANLSRLNPAIGTMTFGNLSMDYSQLCLGQVFNQTGISAKGAFQDAFGYDVFYASQKSGGFSLGGQLTPYLASKIPGLNIYGIFLDDERRARIVSTDDKYHTAVFRQFMNYGAGLIQKIQFRKGIQEMVVEMGYAHSSENNKGTAVLSPDYSRDLSFVPGYTYQGVAYNSILLADDVYRANISFNRIAGLRLYQKFEFKRVGINYMGANSGEWLPFLAFGIGNKLHIELLNNAEIIRRVYWKDQIGGSSETKFSWRNLDLMVLADLGAQDSRQDYRYDNIWCSLSYSLSKFNFSYDFENRAWQNATFAPENELTLTHEWGLRFLLDPDTLLKSAYGLFRYTKNGSLVYDNQVIFFSLSRRVLSNVVASATYKKTLTSAGETPPWVPAQGVDPSIQSAIQTATYFNLNLTVSF